MSFQLLRISVACIGILEALAINRWMAPMAGALFGTLTGKSLKGKSI